MVSFQVLMLGQEHAQQVAHGICHCWVLVMVLRSNVQVRAKLWFSADANAHVTVRLQLQSEQIPLDLWSPRIGLQRFLLFMTGWNH